MISENPVFAVLVTSGNQAVAAAGINPYDLKAGQLGVFDYDTNKSIDGTKTAENGHVYFAVGVNREGAAGTAATDIKKSAGNAVKKIGIRAIAQNPYTAGVNQKLSLVVGKIIPDKEYTVKFQIQNQEAYSNYGYNVPSKYFAITGGPEANADSGLADTNDFIQNLAFNINLDEEKILVATMKDGVTTVTAEGYTAWKETVGNEDKVLTLEIEVMPQAYKVFSGINLNYARNRATVVIPSLVDFGPDTTITTTQEVVFEDMSGKDIKQMEYESGGWEGNPGIYRQSEAAGLESFESFANTAIGYDTYSLTYENPGIGGGLQYHSSLQTVIAVPSADDTTATAVKDLINRMYNGMELADGAALLAAPAEDGQTAQ